MKVAIMAGGTGGHIFPGLAVAKELAKQNVDVVWLGAVGGMEEDLVNNQQIPLKLLNIKGLRGKGLKGMLSLPFKLVNATWNARKFFKSQQVKAVISMGGYVAGPGGLAAKMMSIPLLVHEQNSKFGMTNKYLSKWAKKVLTGFNLEGQYGAQWVGNPVREDIENIIKLDHNADCVNVLIMGGSLGASSLNNQLPTLLNPYLKNNAVAIKHQCGKNNRDETIKRYHPHEQLQVQPFINDMGQAYAWADFIIARAGALTIAEINAVGLAAILVPYPHAVDDHQTQNAKKIVDNKAGFIWQEKHDSDVLKTMIDQLVTDQTLRQKMAQHSKRLHKKDAAKQVANLCLEMIK